MSMATGIWNSVSKKGTNRIPNILKGSAALGLVGGGAYGLMGSDGSVAKGVGGAIAGGIAGGAGAFGALHGIARWASAGVKAGETAAKAAETVV